MSSARAQAGIAPSTLSLPALEVRDLASAWAGPFSLSLAGGECLAVQGPSGSGKSQLLRMIADLDQNSGEVTLYGQIRESMKAPDWRRQVVYQAAEPAWWEATAGEHFSLAQADRVAALLPRLGLREAHLTADVMRLSTGERQRMALIRSLAVEPCVLLLDEPTAALDGPSVEAVEQLLRERLQAGLAIVLVTHSTQQAERMGDRQMTIAPRPR
jgi:ABC-type iron transport system FetAB ATPase subunit